MENKEFMALVDIGRYVVRLSNKARRDGLLALEAFIKENKLKDEKLDIFMQMTTMRIIDGLPSDIVREICEEIIMTNYTKETEIEKAKRGDAKVYFTLLDALIGLQHGENPRIIEDRIMSRISNEKKSEFYDLLMQRDENEEILDRTVSVSVADRFLQELHDGTYLQSQKDLVIKALTDHEQEEILRYVMNSDAKTQFMYFSSLITQPVEVIEKVLKNASENHRKLAITKLIRARTLLDVQKEVLYKPEKIKDQEPSRFLF